MATTIIRPATREEWLSLRRQGIGSSEIATIAGLNPYDTPYQLWLRRTGRAPEIQENAAMRAGHFLEDAVARLFADATGREIEEDSAADFIVRRDDTPFLQVSPDRFYRLPESEGGARERGILECKTTRLPVDPDSLPPHWFCQIQYQLGVAGLTRGSLAWLIAGRDFGYADITLAPDFFEWLVGLAARFMRDNIEGNTPPDPISGEDTLLRFPSHAPGVTREAAPETFAAYEELKGLRERMRADEERKKTLEDSLKIAFADAEALTYAGRTIATWKAPKPSRRVDTKALIEAHPDIAREYEREVENPRRLLLK